MKTRRKQRLAMAKFDQQMHARAWKHARTVLAGQNLKITGTNTEQKRSGRHFTVTLPTEDGNWIPFSFHLDPQFRVTCQASTGHWGNEDPCIHKRQQAQLACIRSILGHVLGFRSMSLLTAALTLHHAGR